MSHSLNALKMFRASCCSVLLLLLLTLGVTGCGSATLDGVQAVPPESKKAPTADQSKALEDDVYRDLAAAFVHLQSARLHEARAQLSEVLEKDPHNAWALLNLGVTLQRMGLHLRAREMYLRALEIPQGDRLTLGAVSQAGVGSSLHDLARHNLRSVDGLLLLEKLSQTKAKPNGKLDRRQVVVDPAAPAAGKALGAGLSGGVDATLETQNSILRFVSEWRDAWAGRRVSEYLAHYLPGFAPAGLTHDQWRDARHIRLSSARDVDIEFREVRIHAVSNHIARVVFRQSYRDQRYSDVGCKTLVLQRQETEWKIRAEEFVKPSVHSQCE